MTHRAFENMSSLEQEFEWYLENKDDLINKHEGRVLVIKDEKVIGIFDDDMEAIRETMPEHELGTFLVQECSSDPHSTEVTFHSGVWF